MASGNLKFVSSVFLYCQSGRGSIPVWEFDGTFENRAAHFKVTSTTGHVFERDFVETHRSWNSDPLQLFDAETIKSECKEGGKIIKTLVNAAKGCSFLILWLDCDREGENICFEVIQIVQSHLLPLPSVIRQILRAKFSSLDAKDVKKAFQSLVLPDKNISDSVEARQEIDLKIGCAFTRFQTRFFQEKYGDLNATVLSYGPCQTPTLYFCVERYDEIQNFEAETYFKLNVLLKAGEMEISLRWQRGVVFDEAVATLYKELVESSTTIATVHSVHEEAEIRRKVLPLDTCTFLKKSSSLCQIGPHTAMQIAERLYLSQIITYPRTETSVYPSSFPLLETAKLFQNHPILGESTRELLKNGLQKARQGVDAQDHPPITPLKLISREFLGNENEWKLYDMICRHFLASVSGDCHFRKQKIIFEISSEIFSSTKRRLIDRGFTVFTPIPENNEGFLPLLIKGDKLVISKVFISKHQTAPPPCLSESDLIELMRKNGIGTDASIPQHINNIQERNYVSLVANRRLQPSKLGLSIIHGFSSVDRELILPHVRAAIEASISIIAEGNLFSRCGHCKRYMTFIPKEPIRLFCKHCNVTYRMPSGGTIKLYQELKCPLDEFELVFFTKKDLVKCVEEEEAGGVIDEAAVVEAPLNGWIL
ncbi:putative Dna topoisomerase III beta-1, partial [Cardiosporidium cionae]